MAITLYLLPAPTLAYPIGERTVTFLVALWISRAVDREVQRLNDKCFDLAESHVVVECPSVCQKWDGIRVLG